MLDLENKVHKNGEWVVSNDEERFEVRIADTIKWAYRDLGILIAEDVSIVLWMLTGTRSTSLWSKVADPRILTYNNRLGHSLDRILVTHSGSTMQNILDILYRHAS